MSAARGHEFPQHEVTIVRNIDHFDLIAADRLLMRQVDELVTEARARVFALAL